MANQKPDKKQKDRMYRLRSQDVYDHNPLVKPFESAADIEGFSKKIRTDARGIARWETEGGKL